MGCASSNQRQDQRSAGFYTLRKQQTADLLRSNAAPQPESLADPPLSAAITRRVSDAEPRTEGGQAGPPGATLPANGSAAPAQPPWDVFVSHRGPDTKMGFVDALQRHMKARRVFVDRVGLQPGQRNWETIRAALAEAKITLVVLSPGFQRSAWCLEELRLAVELAAQHPPPERHLRIVFFNVKPSFVDHAALAEALQEAQRDGSIRAGVADDIMLRDWRTSLSHASSTVGWEYNSRDKSLLELVHRVGLDLERNLPRQPRSDAPIFGLEHRVRALVKLCRAQQEDVTTVLGLTGMGGIGKTTLANALFNSLSDPATSACFVPDIRSVICEPHGTEQLQQKMLQDLVDLDCAISDSAQGRDKLRSWLKGRKVLLVLDDLEDGNVQHLLHMAAGRPAVTSFGAGSIVIMTSRDRRVLQLAGCQRVERVDVLEPDWAWHMFSSHVDVSSIPSSVDQPTISQVVKLCGGLPLSLKIVGAYLFERSSQFWEAALARLQTAGQLAANGENLFDQLRMSYDGLDPEEREMFVDIACIYDGRAVDEAKAIWVGRGWFADVVLQTLLDRCLVTTVISPEDERVQRLQETHAVEKSLPQHVFAMHDQLRDLGRSIEVRAGGGMQPTPETKRRRIWTAAQLTGREADTRRHAAGLQRQDRLQLPLTVLPDMADFESLQLLDLRDCASVTTLPASIQHLQLLQYLNVDGCSQLRSLPDEFGLLARLQQLSLKRCKSLATLPDSFGGLHSLEALILTGCSGLQALPESVGCLNKLRVLDLWHCEQLPRLPTSIGSLSSLEQLSVGPTAFLTFDGMGPFERGLCTLPQTFCKLNSLQHLNLANNQRLSGVLVLDSMTSLTHLNLCRCCQVSGFPGIERLTLLQHLDLGACSLRILPPDFGQLTALSWLGMAQCRRLCQLPESFGQLRSLQFLGLDACVQLARLPNSFGQLTSLQHLILTECRSLKQLPDSLGQLTSLRRLMLYNCVKLRKLPHSCWSLQASIGGECFARRTDATGKWMLLTRAWPMPSWARMATVEDARNCWQELSKFLDQWDIVQLADGYCSGSSHDSQLVVGESPPLTLRLVLKVCQS